MAAPPIGGQRLISGWGTAFTEKSLTRFFNFAPYGRKISQAGIEKTKTNQ